MRLLPRPNIQRSFRPRLEALEDRCLLSAGQLDLTFSGDGLATTIISPTLTRAADIALQPDGQIVVAGGARPGSNDDFAVARYNADGSLDTSFGGTGWATTDFGNLGQRGSPHQIAVAVATQQVGGQTKVLAAGTVQTNYSTDPSSGIRIYDNAFALVRFNANGTLDTTFGGGKRPTGKVITQFGSGDDGVRDLLVQPDGKILVAGRATFGNLTTGTGNAFALARYNANGTLDTTFGGGDGLVTTHLGGGESGGRLALQQVGSELMIVVAGESWAINQPRHLTLVRYTANGTLDTSFGTGGKVVTTSDFVTDAEGLAVQGSTIVASGTRYLSTTFPTHGIVIAQYDAAGATVSTFGTNGVVTLSSPTASYSGGALAIQPDGKLVIGGSHVTRVVSGSTTYDEADQLLARLNGADGSLDATFGTGGMTITDFGPLVGAPNLPSEGTAALALQPDGRIVTTWTMEPTGGTGSRFAVARYQGDAGLVAAGGPAVPSAPVAPLTLDQAQSALDEAITRWAATGADADALRSVRVTVTDLSGAHLGLASGTAITLDADAAGWGWFVDPTPWDDSEFTTAGDQGEQGRMDLLTAMMHEMGHLLGHDHADEGVMHETLAAGTREGVAERPTATLDHVFSQPMDGPTYAPTFWGDVLWLLNRKKD